MTPVTSWGRLSADSHRLLFLNDPANVASVIGQGSCPGLPHGKGRSYGDVCLNPRGVLWMTEGMDDFISFDSNTGHLICESGVTLRDIQRMAIPRGWILPVTPGTQMVTVGGAIANDVHGKNHHAQGSFGDHVRWIRLVRTSGETIECGPRLQPEWFAATVGGLGLTGVIVAVELQLKRVAGPWLETETISFQTLDEFFYLSDASEARWEHTVSWIDCLSRNGVRGLFMRGNAIDIGERPAPVARKRTMPIVPPVSLVNQLSLRPLNLAYYHFNRLKRAKTIAHYESFFYPLDNLLEWNRMYGPKGFFQYQSVVPRGVGREAIQAMVHEISRSGEGSFLAVLKIFGDRKPVGMLSFPQSGVTLALDFPNHGRRTNQLFERLDAVVREAGGRIYPAKDARMPRDLFEAGYPQLVGFRNYRDPGISSGLSRRLMGY